MSEASRLEDDGWKEEEAKTEEGIWPSRRRVGGVLRESSQLEASIPEGAETVSDPRTVSMTKDEPDKEWAGWVPGASNKISDWVLSWALCCDR